MDAWMVNGLAFIKHIYRHICTLVVNFHLTYHLLMNKQFVLQLDQESETEPLIFQSEESCPCLWAMATTGSYPFFGGQERVQTLPVNETCSSSVGGQQPDHNCYLQLIVQGKPGQQEQKHETYADSTTLWNSWNLICTKKWNLYILTKK